LAVSLVDVPAALANFTSPEPTINVTLRLDTRGHLATSNAVLYSAAPETESGGVAGALKGLFGKKDKVETEETEEGEGEAGAESNKTVNAKAGKKEKVAIKFKEKFLGVKPMSGEEKRNTQARYVISQSIIMELMIGSNRSLHSNQQNIPVKKLEMSSKGISTDSKDF
jgi:hypoxia up-regulated 1